MKSHRVKIYASKWHLLITLLVILAPFLFLLIFSKVAKMQASELYRDIWISFLRLLVAYIIAALLGWIFAVSFFKGKRALIALPIFDVLQSFPTFAALPLAVYMLGASNLTVILFLVITIIWPVFFSIVSSLKLIRYDWEEAIEMSGIKGFDYLKKFILPVSMPGLITGSIVGLGEGWEALVATEIIVDVKDGLGPFFRLFQSNPTITALGIFGFLLIIFSINKLIWIPLLDWSHKKMEE